MIFSMVFMMYGAAKPDWWCADGLHSNSSLTTNMSAYKSCHVTFKNETRDCGNFVFAEGIKTVVTEVCSFFMPNLIPDTGPCVAKKTHVHVLLYFSCLLFRFYNIK